MSSGGRASLLTVALGAVVLLGACGSGGSGTTGGAAGSGGADGQAGSGAGGQGGSNAAGDGGVDATIDGSGDATGDGGVDAAIDGSGDATTDSGGDGATDAATDGSGDVPSDGGVDATPAVCGTGSACGGDLSNVGTGNFCISFTLNTTAAQGETAILNQRPVCGASNFWDIRAQLVGADAGVDGGSGASFIGFEADVDSTNDVAVNSLPYPMNDGRPHVILVRRVSGVVTISVDGTATGTRPMAIPFGALPALATGADVCVGVDGTHALTGSLAGVCITH